MRAGKAIAAVLCACAVALPSGAYAVGTQPTSGTGQTESSVTVTETDEIASGYSWKEGDCVFESLRLEGTDGDYSHTAQVWGYLAGNHVTFYIQHQDGTTEMIRRYLPGQTGTPGADDYLSTVTINFPIDGWALVTGVVDMGSSQGTPGSGMQPTGVSVSYLESCYASFKDALSHDAKTAENSSCSVTVSAKSQSDITSEVRLDAVPTLETPGDANGVLKRYAEGYCPPSEGGLCLGSFEFLYAKAESSGQSSNEPTTGFKIKVDPKYAGMKAVSYLSYDQLSDYGGYNKRATIHEMTVQEDGTFVVPFGSAGYASGSDSIVMFPDFSTRNTPVYGVLTINIEPKETLPSGTVVDYNGEDKVKQLANGATVAIESSSVNLDISTIDSVSPYYDISYRIYPYTDEFASDSVGHIWYRINVGRQYAGTTAVVKIYRYEFGPDFDASVYDAKICTVGDDGTFLVMDRINVTYQDASQGGGVEECFAGLGIVLEEPVTINLSEKAVVASIPEQTWTGSPITPKPNVTVEGTTLVEGADYELTYENNIDAGTAMVIITGMGNYTGELRVPFKIVTSTTPSDPGGSGGSTDPDTPDDPDEDEPKPDYPALDRPFVDVASGTWYYDAICRVSDLGIMNGYDDGTFGPDDPLAREQAAGVLYNYLGEKDASAPSAPHADVAQGQWYSPAVNWAVENGVMGGYGGTNLFGIGDALTREQFAAIIANAAGADVSKADRSVLERYPDGDEITDWAVDSVAWAVENGIINGVELRDGTLELRATETMSRAQMAAMILNAIDAGVL